MLHKRNHSIIILSLLLGISLFACITPAGITSSTTPLRGKEIVNHHGKVKGTDSTWSVLGIWMFGRPDIDDAIQDALSKKGGNALVNVRCYNDKMWFLLFSIDRVIVEGEAVTLDKSNTKRYRK